MRPRSGVVNALLFTATSLAALAAAEVVARSLAPFRIEDGTVVLSRTETPGPEPARTWEVDGVPLWMFDHDGRHIAEEPKSRRRIIFLGDSIIAPLALHDSQGVIARLQTILDETQPIQDVEVVNLAEEGFNARQLGALFEDVGLALHPDVAIIAVSPNDHIQYVWEDNALYLEEYLDTLSQRSGRGGALGQLCRSSYFATWTELALLGLFGDLHKMDESAVLLPLQRIHEVAKDVGVRLAIICLPGLEPPDDAFHPEAPGCAYPSLEEWARVRSLPYLDPNPAYAPYAPVTLRLDGLHLNEFGHRILAVLIANWMVESGLMPSNPDYPLPLPPPNLTGG